MLSPNSDKHFPPGYSDNSVRINVNASVQKRKFDRHYDRCTMWLLTVCSCMWWSPLKLIGHQKQILGSNNSYSRQHYGVADALTAFDAVGVVVVAKIFPLVSHSRCLCNCYSVHHLASMLLTVNSKLSDYCRHSVSLMNASVDASAVVENAFFGTFWRERTKTWKFHQIHMIGSQIRLMCEWRAISNEVSPNQNNSI